MNSEPGLAMDGEGGLREQFEDLEQQRSTGVLGMWVFLGSEVLFFGGVFLAYTVYRQAWPGTFAEASGHLRLWLATANTVVLLASSFAMALADSMMHESKLRSARRAVWLTLLLGMVFLAIKACEYYLEYNEGLIPFLGNFRYGGADPAHAAIFFNLYFSMTGLHAVHLIVGLGLLVWFLRETFRRYNGGSLQRQVEITALYWHFVDVVWVFLFPVLYLVR